jgi:hypothetical protein
MKGFHAFAAGAVLALGLATLAGTAIAGNENGNSGNGNQPAATPAPVAAAPGNSASAPGQQKQQAQPAATPAAQPQSSAPGQQKKAASSTQPGVKPSSVTAHSTHWTHCSTTTTALPAGCAGNGPKADSSKRYGNGKTAAQIAISRGAPLDTKLTGPGNSQPHKVTACGKPSNKSGGVDVHAVKSYDASACAPKSAPATQVAASSAQSSTPQSTASSALFVASASAPSAPTAGAAASPTAASAGASVPSAGGVLGAQATIGSPAAKHSGGGVLGTVARVAGTQLPFTGLELWIVVLVAAALLTGGMLLRQYGRAAMRS